MLFLRDWGVHLRPPFFRREVDHKREVIEAVLDVKAPLPCILVGDSGQSDPEIYTDLARRMPERVSAVIIRGVSSNTRDASVLTLKSELDKLSVPLIYAELAKDFRQQAAYYGLID